MLVKYENYRGPLDELNEPTLIEYKMTISDTEMLELINNSALISRDYNNPSQFYYIDLNYVLDDCICVFLCNGEEMEYKLCLKNGHEVYFISRFNHKVFNWKKSCNLWRL